MKYQGQKGRVRTAALLLCAALLAALLPGCGSSVKEAEGEHEPITISTVQIDFPKFAAALKEKYPEVNLQPVSYDGGNGSGYLQWSMLSGDLPDIVTDTYFRDNALYRTRLLELTDYDFVNSYAPSMLDQVDIDGSIYLLPSAYQVCGIYYNKGMFAEHGWQVPTDFEQLKTLIGQIEAEGITAIGANMRLTGHPFNYFFSINNTGFFGTPAGEQWKRDFLNGEATATGNLEACAAYFQEWIDAGILTADDVGNRQAWDDFISGDQAMLLNLTCAWHYENDDGTTVDVGIIPWLSRDGSKNMVTTSVRRYFGLNKNLSEPGNEQKLADALKVMEFLSTEEGQYALSAPEEGVYLPLKDTQIAEDDPLYEVHELIEQGYTAPLTYAGWVDYMLYPMSEDLTAMIRGEMTAEEFVADIDASFAQHEADPDVNVLATAEDDLTKAQAARLSGNAMLWALEKDEGIRADAALVSLGDYIDGTENATGVNCPIYAGKLDQEKVNAFSPWGQSMATMELTGAEIKELAETGKDHDGVGKYFFPYVLTLREGVALQDEETYTVAFNLNDYTPALSGRAETVALSVPTAITEYITQLGSFSAADFTE